MKKNSGSLITSRIHSEYATDDHIIGFIVSNGFHEDAYDMITGRHVISEAIMAGRSQLVLWMLENGSMMDIKDEHGLTPNDYMFSHKNKMRVVMEYLELQKLPVSLKKSIPISSI